MYVGMTRAEGRINSHHLRGTLPVLRGASERCLPPVKRPRTPGSGMKQLSLFDFM